MILQITKTKEGSEWQVSNIQDKMNRWAGTVRLSEDQQTLKCDCLQAEKYIHCTHESQVWADLEKTKYKVEKMEKKEFKK